MTHIPIVIGNWKANPLTLERANELTRALKKQVKATTTEVVIAPPAPFISQVGKGLSKGWAMGVQNVFEEMGGAYTGEHSVSMCMSLGATYFIVGHSERRARGETDTQVAQKTALILKQRQNAVVCVGEVARDKRGDYFDFVKSQVETIAAVVTPTSLKNLVIAYEPIWAIGTGKNATPHDALEMKLFIQKVLTDTLGRAAAQR